MWSGTDTIARAACGTAHQQQRQPECRSETISATRAWTQPFQKTLILMPRPCSVAPRESRADREELGAHARDCAASGKPDDQPLNNCSDDACRSASTVCQGAETAGANLSSACTDGPTKVGSDRT